ncbi:MAG: hypothetical protein IJX80_05385 [Clostridia bacterium]|nr:hypothetical protein [Clostridia bacterium]
MINNHFYQQSTELKKRASKEQLLQKRENIALIPAALRTKRAMTRVTLAKALLLNRGMRV